MKCTLCESPITDYNVLFNHLKIDESHSLDICQDCIDKIVKWQQSGYAHLFPTKTSKKYLEKQKNKSFFKQNI